MARIFLERREFGEEARRLLNRLEGEQHGGGAPGECSPPVDVIETESTIEVLLDVPGVSPEAIQVVFSRGSLLIAGHKLPPVCDPGGATFHLAERCFGRFARVVRLSGAFDLGRARAVVSNGEVRVVLPRIAERRGRDIRIEVQAR